MDLNAKRRKSMQKRGVTPETVSIIENLRQEKAALDGERAWQKELADRAAAINLTKAEEDLWS